MGYCVTLRQTNFKIKKENFENAKEALVKEGCKKRWAWVWPEDLKEAKDLADAFLECDWYVYCDEAGDIVDLELYREKLGDDDEIFSAVAPYVENGSWIEMLGEDGDKWRWYFLDGKCLYVEPKVVWEV